MVIRLPSHLLTVFRVSLLAEPTVVTLLYPAIATVHLQQASMDYVQVVGLNNISLASIV